MARDESWKRTGRQGNDRNVVSWKSGRMMVLDSGFVQKEYLENNKTPTVRYCLFTDRSNYFLDVAARR